MEDSNKLKLEAMQSLIDKKKDENQKARINATDRSVNLAKGDLDKDVFKVKGGQVGADLTDPTTRMNVGTQHIDTKEIRKIGDAADFAERNAAISLKGDLKSTLQDAIKRGDKGMVEKLQKIAAKIGAGARVGLKSVPIVGGIAAATLLGAEDASAAIPGLDSAESAGMSGADENQMMAEIQGRKDYGESQAAEDAKKNKMAILAKLAELKGNQ